MAVPNELIIALLTAIIILGAITLAYATYHFCLFLIHTMMSKPQHEITLTTTASTSRHRKNRSQLSFSLPSTRSARQHEDPYRSLLLVAAATSQSAKEQSATAASSSAGGGASSVSTTSEQQQQQENVKSAVHYDYKHNQGSLMLADPLQPSPMSARPLLIALTPAQQQPHHQPHQYNQQYSSHYPHHHTHRPTYSPPGQRGVRAMPLQQHPHQLQQQQLLDDNTITLTTQLLTTTASNHSARVYPLSPQLKSQSIGKQQQQQQQQHQQHQQQQQPQHVMTSIPTTITTTTTTTAPTITTTPTATTPWYTAHNVSNSITTTTSSSKEDDGAATKQSSTTQAKIVLTKPQMLPQQRSEHVVLDMTQKK